jgi:hypothetical protein
MPLLRFNSFLYNTHRQLALTSTLLPLEHLPPCYWFVLPSRRPDPRAIRPPVKFYSIQEFKVPFAIVLFDMWCKLIGKC